MNYKLTTLVENELSQGSHLIKEHGLSIFIESPNGKILFDTGQSDAFLKNAKALDVPLEELSNVVISHGHYDHSGGLMALIDEGIDKFKLNVSQYFFREKFKNEMGKAKYIGNQFHIYDFAARNIDCNIIKNDINEIFPDIFLVTNFERICVDETPNPKFFYREEGECVIDTFDDEVALLIRSQEGLVLIFGCSHPGVMNMIQSIKKSFQEPLKMLIGGTHLVNADDKRIDETIRMLKDLNIDRIGVSHCTGEKAAARIKEEFGERFFHNRTGSVIEFD